MATHGYVPYKPQPYGASVLKAVRQICIQYEAWEQSLTVRQIFYRLVAEYSYDKTEAAYGSLIGLVARSRRAYQHRLLELLREGKERQEAVDEAISENHLIPFRWIRDEKGQSVEVRSYEGVEDFLDAVRSTAEQMKLDRQEGQPQMLELWCEAAGMVPLMVSIADAYGIRVSSGGGYDSVTAKHKLAQRVLSHYLDTGQGTTVLHIGDFDPSGEGMFETLDDDVGEMVFQMAGSHVLQLDRIALTEDQVIEMGVETAPPKPTDSRRKAFVAKHVELRERLGSDDISAQLEALTPPDLRRLVQEAIESRLDEDAYQMALDHEREIRDRLSERLA